VCEAAAAAVLLYLFGYGRWLVLIWYERKALLVGWLTSEANRVDRQQ